MKTPETDKLLTKSEISIRNLSQQLHWINDKEVARMESYSGRIYLSLLAILILVAGLVLDKWWWQIGALLIIVLFVNAYSRYRTLD